MVTTSYPLAFSTAVCQYIDMFCIHCFYRTTRVVNSRPSKKQPRVWRRRRCTRCDTVFTTYERASVEGRDVHYEDGSVIPFNTGKLTISINKAFAHDPKRGALEAGWLCESVEEFLSSEHAVLTPEDIAAVTHQTLRRFDTLAAMQYAAAHQLLAQ